MATLEPTCQAGAAVTGPPRGREAGPVLTPVAPAVADTEADADAVTALGPERFTNRELSWLEFGARLLDLGADDRRAAARAGQVPGHLLRRPRRVLPGARGGPEGPGRRRPAGALGRRAAPERDPARHRGAGDRARRPPVPDLPRRHRPGAVGGGRAAVELVVARRRRPGVPGGRVRAPDLPGAHAPVGRPGPSLPLHLEPVAQPHRPGGRSHHRRGARGAGEGPAAAAAASW